MLQEEEQRVLQGSVTSFMAAKRLLDTYFSDLRK